MTPAERLIEEGIRLKRWEPGSTQKTICPTCHGGDTREPSLSVTIDRDDQGAVAQCFRAKCGWKFSWRANGRPDAAIPVRQERTKPRAHAPSALTNRPDWLYEFFAARNIGARTVQDFGIYAMNRNFGEKLGVQPAIVFPYLWRGEIVNRKYRPFPAKNPMLQEKDAIQTLYNVDALGEAPTEIGIVEGEVDCLALHECGIRHVVTLKDGAPAQVNDSNSKRFEALATHADILEKCPRIVLCGDMDAPGLALREELARRLGRHRCWLVTWPEGCKDACDVLSRHGPDAVVAAYESAKAYPIEGLQYVDYDRMVSLRHGRQPPLLKTGNPAIDSVLSLPGEGRLIVITGIPGGGKTTFLTYLAVQLMERHDRKFAIFSPEMQPWDEYAAAFYAVWMKVPFWPHSGLSSMTDEDIANATRWFLPRVAMLSSDAENFVPSIDWIMGLTREAILRHGTTDLVIDPWNEVEHNRGDMSETEYIGRALQRLKAFAFRNGCNVWIIAHPRMQRAAKPGEAIPPPGMYEISGSGNWYNKADIGLVIHTPSDLTEVHIAKTRWRRWGRKHDKALLKLDEPTGVYYDPGQSSKNEDLGRWG